MQKLLDFFKKDESVNDFVDSLYENMKTNISFIDYKFTFQGKTKLYETLEEHKNKKNIQPDFLTNIDFHEFQFEGIRHLKMYEVMVPHEIPGAKMQNSSGVFKMEFSVYYSLKKPSL
jgi:hypothetical protein